MSNNRIIPRSYKVAFAACKVSEIKNKNTNNINEKSRAA